MIGIRPFYARDALIIFNQLRELSGWIPDYPEDKLIQAYQSLGSQALTLCCDDDPYVCGGIMNQEWHRGEAWLLVSPYFKTQRIALRKVMKQFLVTMARSGGFRRVQATCWDQNRVAFFRKLGFDFEGVLRSFGPTGQTAFLFSRIFP